MTLLPPALVQSSLGEKCAVYLDQVTDNLPLHLQSLRLRLDPILTYLSSTPLGPLAQKLPLAADDQPLALLAAVIICLFTVAVMSWRNPLNFLRRSPSYAPASNPQVNDEHFSYITPGDIVDPPADDAEPDIIALRHRGTIYPLHFRAYSIDDGILTVGDVREEAAKKTDAGFSDRVRLLYKGKLLKDDQRTCKAEGLKQHSEVLCVVSEVGASELSDDSGPSVTTAVPAAPATTQSRPTSAEASSPPTPTGKSKKGRKNKRNKKTTAPEPVPTVDLSSNPAPVPDLKQLRTPLEKISALAGWLKQEMIPRCDQYVADPPSDPKKRDYDYKCLSETILRDVILKTDGIESDGDETRFARRALIKEAQAALSKLDSLNV
ncbi:Ubiquitin supergroup [Penicillium brevicompactum]|uniref:Ubiquitin supergroup n=1 Tax=Penicillium brevicompactum TaxID=5074 RepID=A0A9W9V3T8_PENBR|nr:Ubiquitin supergroup [Penicillium brevicompactum]